jgi:flagellar biosynthesis protein FliQ
MPETAVFFDTLRRAVDRRRSCPRRSWPSRCLAGIGIGLFQALTSIQEMTLTFVPKLAAMIAVFWVSMSMMTDMLVAFFTDGVVPRIVEF